MLKQTAEHVLWFSEQLGLTATEVVFENTASQSLTVELNGKTSSTPNPPNSKEKDTLLQVYANNNNNNNNSTITTVLSYTVLLHKNNTLERRR